MSSPGPEVPFSLSWSIRWSNQNLSGYLVIHRRYSSWKYYHHHPWLYNRGRVLACSRGHNNLCFIQYKVASPMTNPRHVELGILFWGCSASRQATFTLAVESCLPPQLYSHITALQLSQVDCSYEPCWLVFSPIPLLVLVLVAAHHQERLYYVFSNSRLPRAWCGRSPQLWK